MSDHKKDVFHLEIPMENIFFYNPLKEHSVTQA